MSDLASSYYLRGLIPETSQILIVTVDSFGILYYLTVVPDGDDATVVFDPRSSGGSLFTFETSGSGVVFSTVFNGIEYNLFGRGKTIPCEDGTNIALASASLNTLHMTVEAVTVEVSLYSTLLVGVEFTVFTLNGIPIAFPMLQVDSESGTDEHGNPLGILDPDIFGFNYDTTVRFVSIPQYPAGDCSNLITDIQNVKDTEADWVYGLNDPIPKAYANELACSNGIFFNYCGYSLQCSANCKGSCDSLATCTFQAKTGTFACTQEQSTPIEQSRTLFQNPVTWIVIIIVIIVLIIIIIILFTTNHSSAAIERRHQALEKDGFDSRNNPHMV